MEACSKEFHRDVLLACDAGERTSTVATQLKVSESCVRHIKQQRRKLCWTAPLTKHRCISKWHALWDDVRRMVMECRNRTPI